MTDKLLTFLKKIKFTSVVDDSRKVTQGVLFVAIKGAHFDAHEVLKDVVKKGAVGVVGEKNIKDLTYVPENYFQVASSRQALGEIAAFINGDPSKKMEVIGVTGTDGKTTTANIIYHLLSYAQKKVGVISTINAVVGNQNLDTGFHVTNPEPLQLQSILTKMVKSKTKIAVLEVTSHGLDQDRVAGVKFDAAVLTNITHEHIDYHKTFANYREAKLKLFLTAQTAVLNADDPSFNYFHQKLSNKKVITYSLNTLADFQAVNITEDQDGLVFEVLNENQNYLIHSLLFGRYNISNLLAGIAVARLYGVDWLDIQKALTTFQSPKGRLEEVKNTRGFRTFVDFAHTPNSLENLLKTARRMTDKRVIAVFGCAGERDIAKRPLMAGIATSLADLAIFTAEDPRHEKIEDIFSEMIKGVVPANRAKYLTIPDRMEAIRKAVSLAQTGDLVVICGKGHEQSMCFGDEERPWSDQEALKEVLI